jgi:DNA processing protein
VSADGSANGDVRDAVCLAMVRGVGPLHRKSLLARFGSPSGVLSAAPSDLLQVDGIGPKIAERIAAARDEIDAERELAVCRSHGIDVLLQQGETYPAVLREIPDPPGLLFCRGAMTLEDRLAIGIVGTRHATQYGRQQARKLAGSLARAGLTVVSGLARGIDGEAHLGALEAGGRTIAVLASGVLNIYPPEHKRLADDVAAGGAVVSESPPNMEPLAGMFPQRNRIISGLSLGVIVIEAAERSGALITARHAMEQGREVFALPGRVDTRQSRGCHRLLKDGAKLVETADDVLEELGPLFEAAPREDGTEVRHPAELKLNEIEQAVLQEIETVPTSIDTVVQATGMPVHRVLATVSVLEMRRLVRRVSGNQVVRI